MQFKSAGNEISSMQTEELLVHQEAQKNEEFYRDLFIEALDGIVFWTVEDGIIEANESACKIFESSESELKHKKIEDFVFSHPSNYNRILKDLYSRGSVRDELVFLMPNGQKKILEFTTKLHSANGHRMTIFRNVTERYEMEQELRESERKFRSIFEGAVEGLILWNDKFEIVDVNSSGEKLLHANKEEIIGHSLLSILAQYNVKEEDMSEHVDLFKSKEHSCGVITFVSETGERTHVEYATKKNVFSNLNMTTFKDITDKLQMEEHLRKSDTLSVIGQLAAGIAHEIRNPMTALKGFIQLLEDTIKEDHSMYFGVIKNELNRIDSIINEFLVLAKPQAMKYLEKDIVQLMKETIELLKPQAVLHNVQFQLTLETEIPYIYCEPNQLKKVFINIIKNAIEVMSNGGFIRIAIRKVDGDQVLVSIQDEGEGIDPEKLRRLGEPFFTTKEKGTGLGLMVSYKIISEHQGQIDVESEQGKGTVFYIKLPIRRV
ncbi:PAS domain-containing sensor histidine kinase [Robertmurraya kyonggiensis]|uniref:histidine kinase n=1 Tax=Robertmurraya kyonggiensis TaxID=1037680 RepID=A0A4U1DFE0_9BACI|nr:ATP-binding protein [Robertmurraya kyonggiensis]TKC20117.1 PAS domain S-box protein [Robertmurraya kyonggiensis]